MLTDPGFYRQRQALTLGEDHAIPDTLNVTAWRRAMRQAGRALPWMAFLDEEDQPDDAPCSAIPYEQAQSWLDADPAFATWNEKEHAADAPRVDDWLNTPEGQDWLNIEAERYDAGVDYGYSWERPS